MDMAFFRQLVSLQATYFVHWMVKSFHGTNTKKFLIFSRSYSLYENYFLMEWNAIDKRRVLTRGYRTKYSFINHSCNPNCQTKIINDQTIHLYAKTTIEPNHELLLDYREEPLPDDYLTNSAKRFLYNS